MRVVLLRLAAKKFILLNKFVVGRHKTMGRIEEIPVDSLLQMVCLWKGCDKVVFVGDILPAGWKCIVASPGSLFKAKNLINADVDGVLCPVHFAEFKKLLKIG
jgi:hypothetical protein